MKPSFLLRILKWTAVTLAVLLVAATLRCLWAFRDRHPGYTLQLNISDQPARIQPSPLQVGFGRVRINPDLSNPRRPVWLAGFSQNRAATAIHDDLWALACVVDDGKTRLGIVALDAIGFFHDQVISVRSRLPSEWKLAYTIVCATHNHNTPDLLGLWGPHYLKTGVDPLYREQVIQACVDALGQAVRSLQPALLALHHLPMPTEGLVADTRKPIVFDPDIRIMQFLNPSNGATLGTIVGWANHPETVWSGNTEITSDFCGYLRDALEKGFTHQSRVVTTGLGGTHLYINGAVGGLMSTTPGVTVRDPFLKEDFKKPTHEKARAVGHQLAARILPALTNRASFTTNIAPISIRAKTLRLPVANLGYLAGPVLGLLDRGHTGWKHIRTEVALVTLGDASIACVPGEIYPEIVNGGIEQAPGADYGLPPVEVPPLRALMPGRFQFVFGLANDEIGYLIPKSEWDQKPPYLYGSTRSIYGEINSCGPDSARLIHAALRELCTPVN